MTIVRNTVETTTLMVLHPIAFICVHLRPFSANSFMKILLAQGNDLKIFRILQSCSRDNK